MVRWRGQLSWYLFMPRNLRQAVLQVNTRAKRFLDVLVRAGECGVEIPVRIRKPAWQVIRH
jgi:hypothetical protein